MVWKILMVVEKRFRRMRAPELMKTVYIGEQYEDWVAMQTEEEVAARSPLGGSPRCPNTVNCWQDSLLCANMVSTCR